MDKLFEVLEMITEYRAYKEGAKYGYNKAKEELEKENVELKSIAQFQTTSNMDRYFQLKRSKEQLTKARELLKQFLTAKNGEDTYKAEWEAEQFLKDSEVEK